MDADWYNTWSWSLVRFKWYFVIEKKFREHLNFSILFFLLRQHSKMHWWLKFCNVLVQRANVLNCEYSFLLCRKYTILRNV